GLVAEGAGAGIEATGTSITTLGLQSHGAQARAGGGILLDNVTIGTEGDMAHGLYSSGAGSLADAKVSAVTVTGNSAAALFAENEGLIHFTAGTVNVSGANSLVGMVANGSLLSLEGSMLESTDGDGIRLEDSATLTLT